MSFLSSILNRIVDAAEEQNNREIVSLFCSLNRREEEGAAKRQTGFAGRRDSAIVKNS